MFSLVIVVLIIAVSLDTISNRNNLLPRVGRTFVDSTGIKWRVLTRDSNGNTLIITEYAQGAGNSRRVRYNLQNIYSCLSESDISLELSRWFTDMLAPELQKIALPVGNINENQITVPRITNAGLSTPENTLFILSISEVNKYNRRGRLLRGNQIHSWWLRSPSNDISYPIAAVKGDTIWEISKARADDFLFFRPALWTRNYISK